ncbi:glycerol-3-phosphate dehydrogenase/oxidase [Microbacterium bovistercoris]|uniref:Glycerol-3-phosphate dehydrogenase n=1 Tax=Microbacterium bovistercoris TaxID=2293570 RepID=A0A371NSY7_9MICO|nr:glycerol-3-phosphate dehydrogenase/oxidase [Microbacterium bovistercoris]REJ05418.1 glycerol-3-phosphate dehydrogenase/oxidase [Microbacterium bovistercoris]
MITTSADLNAVRRRDDLSRAAGETVDVLVVGGGITGVGVALDAASRGLSVTLVEAEDLAFGTSRFSSKLVHGGLRYLATGDVATAKESALERHLLMTQIAPHLIRPLPQLLPFAPGVTFSQRSAGAVGMVMGDLLRMRAHTSRRTLPGPRAVSARTARRLVPALSVQGLRGGMLSYDGQLVDDARLVVTVARTAAGLGTSILTRVRAVELRGDGASAEDALTGERFELRARSVINATGVWAGTLDPAIAVRPSRGTHIVLDAADLGHPAAALTIPHPGSISRYVFALPQQHGRVIVGLTDEDAPEPVPRVAAPTEAEIVFLLDSVNRVLAEPIGRDRVRGAFAGLRPLVDTGGESTADVSRRHLVAASDDGFVSVLGGKLTTYRRMAEDAVDLAVRLHGLPQRPSRTAALRLVDAAGGPSEPVADGLFLTREDVVSAVRTELALTVDDVLDRRSRIGLVPEERERALAPVSALVARTLAELSENGG